MDPERFKRLATRFSAVAGPEFIGAIESATSGAELGYSLGSSVGTYGAIGGVAAGFLAGLVSGLVPTARNNAEAAWDRVIESMTPMERYACVAQIRPIAEANAKSEDTFFLGGSLLDRCGPWRWANDPPLGHSPWGGPVGRTVNLLERLARKPWLPLGFERETPENKRVVALYILLFCAGAHDDGAQPWQMRAMWPLIAEGRVAPQLVREFGEWSNVRLGDCRAQAQRMGLRSLWRAPLSPSMRKALAL